MLVESRVRHLNGALDTPAHEHLSDREREVLRRLVAGERPTDIVRALHLSVMTVRTHKNRIQAKFQLHSTAAHHRYGVEQALGPEATAPVLGP